MLFLALFRSQSCVLLSQGPLETVAGTQGPPRSQSQNRPGPPTTWPGRSGGAETEDYRAVPDPGAEPAPMSQPGSAWGLRGVIGSLYLRSSPWVLLTEASSALQTLRLGAWTARPGWSRPQGPSSPCSLRIGRGKRAGPGAKSHRSGGVLICYLGVRLQNASCPLCPLCGFLPPFLREPPPSLRLPYSSCSEVFLVSALLIP